MDTDGIADEKLIEATIYLSQRSLDDPNFGMTKLVKLLYYADCASYHVHREPITAATYVHFPHGPYPDRWYQVRQRMEEQGDVTIVYEHAAPGYHRYRMLPRRNANLELLSPEDQKILDDQIARFTDFNAAAIEEFSHQESSWLSTEDGEPMSYEMAGFLAPPPTLRSMVNGLEVVNDQTTS